MSLKCRTPDRQCKALTFGMENLSAAAFLGSECLCRKEGVRLTDVAKDNERTILSLGKRRSFQ